MTELKKTSPGGVWTRVQTVDVDSDIRMDELVS